MLDFRQDFSCAIKLLVESFNFVYNALRFCETLCGSIRIDVAALGGVGDGLSHAHTVGLVEEQFICEQLHIGTDCLNVRMDFRQVELVTQLGLQHGTVRLHEIAYVLYPSNLERFKVVSIETESRYRNRNGSGSRI